MSKNDAIDAMAHAFEAPCWRKPTWMEYLINSQKQKVYVNSILYNKEETSMSTNPAVIEYKQKKYDLLEEQRHKQFELEQDYKSRVSALDTEYAFKLHELEKEEAEAETKAKSEEHAFAIKAAYDAYIQAGFSEVQAEAFVKIVLEKQ